jgi:cleavage and polyadenylation specificity factor subunit 2
MLEADDLDTDSESGSEADEDAANGIIIAQADPDPEDRMQMSFDIYVKGQQTRVGRGAVGEMARFRMFPSIERRGKKIDEYGEGIDLGLWIRRGREIEEEGETEEVREGKRRKLEEEEKQVWVTGRHRILRLHEADWQKAAPEIPSKFISDTISVDLKASVFYVDMDGLHDGQTIKTIIADLQPRKLVSGAGKALTSARLIARSSSDQARNRPSLCFSTARPLQQSRTTSLLPLPARR